MRMFWYAGMGLALLISAAVSARPSDVRKQVESSLLLTGWIEIDKDGRVSGSTLDQSGKVPKDLTDFVQKQVGSWKFHPVVVDGKVVRARSQMSMRLVAKKLDKDQFSLSIRNANFTGDKPKDEEVVSSDRMTPPRYPQYAAMRGASATVYLVAKIGADGKVLDVLAEQVNLKTISNESEMVRWRALFADASIKAARSWVFVPPTAGELVGMPYWSVRIPVDYKMGSSRTSGYGRWESYIPGPTQTIPWKTGDEPGYSPDTLADGGVYMAGQNNGPRLITPLSGG